MSGNTRIGGLNPGDAEEPSGTIDSMPSFGIGELHSEQGVVLKDWSAQDFANFYVRFRPHLVSYARKFLREEWHAEEVVQDAFLYLMTALPELDSELGVLRFLKWKTRLLCLDVIRAQGVSPLFAAIPLEDETPSSDPDISDNIERADDAALVRLALAQLSPRHREAIVATVFEEKSPQQVAKQMGLSENALRQLLLRARRSFKTVFVGEIEAANMSVSEALNLAAKRHSLKLISGGSLVLVLLLALVSPPAASGPEQPLASRQIMETRLEALNKTPIEASPGGTVKGHPLVESLVNSEAVVSTQGTQTHDGGISLSDRGTSAEPDLGSTTREAQLLGGDAELHVQLASEIKANPLLISENGLALTHLTGQEFVIRQIVSENLLLIVHVSACGEDSQIRVCKIYFEDSRNGNSLIWLARNFAFEQIESDISGLNSLSLDVVGTDFLVGDFGGQFGNVAVNAFEMASIEYLRFRLLIQSQQVSITALELLSSST